MTQGSLFDDAPAGIPPMETCPRCGCCEIFAGECAGKCETYPKFHFGGQWIFVDLALARIEAEEVNQFSLYGDRATDAERLLSGFPSAGCLHHPATGRPMKEG